MGNGPVEPSADMRSMAKTVRDAYLALVQEGFTEKQALQITTELMRAAMGGGAK